MISGLFKLQYVVILHIFKNMNEQLVVNLIHLYKYLNESGDFLDMWLKQNPIKNKIITPIEMKILYGLKYENLKTQRDIENHYNMYRSTIMKTLNKLKSDGLLTIEIKSYKNRTITLTQTGNETIESIFTQIATFYQNMVKNEMTNWTENKVYEDCKETTHRAFLTLGRITKYLPHRNKKV